MTTSGSSFAATPLFRLVAVSVIGALVVVVSWALRPGGGDASAAPRASVGSGWQATSQARAGGLQVLGGKLHAGEPSVQRFVHDSVPFTVSVGPAAPGRNLVRVDTTGHAHGTRIPPVFVGTTEDDLVRARPRPGADGLWAPVTLPAGEGTVLVTHGPAHRIPFTVVTGRNRVASPAWDGSDATECLAASVGTLLAGGHPDAGTCPADRLTDEDREAVTSTVELLAERGVRQLAVDADGSARSLAAREAVAKVAAEHGVVVVAAGAETAERSALLDVSGWSRAAERLAAVSRLPLRRQPLRSDGVWLAPWLLAPGVVDSTAGAMVPLSFDIRDERPREYAQLLARYLPGQAPTAAGFAAWLDSSGGRPGDARLFAASRAAYMPASAGHAGHETQVSWFPGGTITPVGPTGASTSSRP